jgi:hypothetical protein
MAKFALYAHLKAKPGKQAEVEAFLKSALPLAQQETQTVTWYASGPNFHHPGSVRTRPV